MIGHLGTIIVHSQLSIPAIFDRKINYATLFNCRFSVKMSLFHYIPLYDLEYWLDVCVHVIQHVNRLQLLLRLCQDEDHLILQNEVIRHRCLHHFLRHDFWWFSGDLHDDLHRFQNSDVPSYERFVSIFVHFGEVLSELKIFLDSWLYHFYDFIFKCCLLRY